MNEMIDTGTRGCKKCGKPLKTSDLRVKFCSDDCREAHRAQLVAEYAQSDKGKAARKAYTKTDRAKQLRRVRIQQERKEK